MIKNIDHYEVQQFLDRIAETSGFGCFTQEKIKVILESWESLNFKKGSVILLLFPNSKDLLQHIFAVMLAGYVPALVPPATPIPRLNILANQFNAKAIVKYKLFKNGLNRISKLTRINNHDVAVLNNADELLTNAGDIILTTSGTSGFSSGCVFDITALLCNAEKHSNAIGLTATDKILVNLPLYYSYAFVAQALAAFVKGAELIISSPPFNSTKYILDIKKHEVTVSSLTPLLVKELLSNNAQLPTHIRVLTVGGDYLDVNFTKELLSRHPTKELYLTYGITEAGPRVSTLAAHNEPQNRFSSIGSPLPDTKLMIVKESGELLIHSDTLVKKRLGAYGKPLFEIIEGRNWLKTGDIFFADSDGYLYFKSRISDFIILNGEKVNLAAVKKFATEHSGVISAKVQLIKDNSNLIGYDLDIIVQKNFSKNIDEIKNNIKKGLKVFERPKNIAISRFGEGSAERYK